ncbi:MAG: hypothetical protein DSY50_02405 [Desulfobulbus sp.]|nr:MAG: hypothetical protein DSY50_02405 [Desulfobulbus sp.]RUM40000.1 MAG: hypothetical protein DSY70_04595 [Desulfobulbus sp.]
MHEKQKLYKKIVTLYPEILANDIRVDVAFDDTKESWVVDLKKGSRELKHYLDVSDADTCMEGKQCVSLGLEIAQLKNNYAGKQY